MKNLNSAYVSFATILLAAIARGQVALLSKDRLTIRSANASQSIKLRASKVFWSPNGERLALIDDKSSLSWMNLDHPTPAALSPKASDLRWSPDSSRLMFMKGKTLMVAGDEGTKLLAKDVKPGTASWSPNGERVAYASGSQLIVANWRQHTSHKIVGGHRITSVDWSSDGSTIAFEDANGALLTANPNGRNLTQISFLPLTQISWSPNCRYLLGRSRFGWKLLERSGRHFESVDCDPVTRPTWVGGQKLIVAQRGYTYIVRAGDKSATQPFSRLESGLRYWAPAPKVMIDGDVALAKKTALRRPGLGEIRLDGYLESVEPQEGKFWLVVESMMDSNGTRGEFKHLVVQPLQLAKEATQTDGVLSRKLQADDLHDDDQVTLLIQGPSLDPNSEMRITEACVDGVDLDGSRLRLKYAGLRPSSSDVDYDGVTMENVVVPLIFPVAGEVHWSDTFLAPRGGGTRRHHGQDLMGRKMTPLVACFAGTVRLGRSHGISGNCITLEGDNGWQAFYCHLNNDTPGTHDCSGGDRYAFAPGLASGMHVAAGQFLGYLGDSGNAKTTAPHLHFEIKDMVSRAIVNAAPSLEEAVKLDAPSETVVDGSDIPGRLGRGHATGSRKGKRSHRGQ